jgi:hypothetical protein
MAQKHADPVPDPDPQFCFLEDSSKETNVTNKIVVLSVCKVITQIEFIIVNPQTSIIKWVILKRTQCSNLFYLLTYFTVVRYKYILFCCLVVQ